MRFNLFAQAAACALVISSVHGVVDAKPKRPVATSAAKKKAAAASAKRKADRVGAETAAKAAEAAEKARIRAQWGVLADIGEADFENESNMPVTVRKVGGGVELTTWTSIARQMARFERNAATGTLSMTVPGQWSRKTYEARILSDGSIEASTKNDTRWTVMSREPGGRFMLAMMPGGKYSVGPLVAGGKASTKLSTLVASGKVGALGSARETAKVLADGADATTASAAMLASAGSGVPSMAALQAAEGLENMRKMEGDWWNGAVKWSFAPVANGVSYKTSGVKVTTTERVITLRNGGLEIDRTQAVPLAGGLYYPKRGYAIIRKDADRFTVTAGKLKAGSFIAGGDQTLPHLGVYQRMTPTMADAMREQYRQYDLAQAKLAEARAREKASSGNNGLLAGLLMGGMAAAMGGDAGMVMGAAMKGAEMTTDNEMSRNLLAGQGDAMIQSSIDTQRQIAETERLRVAASEEARRKREAQASGRSVVAPPKAPVKTASATTSGSATSAPSGGGSSEEKLTKKTVRAYFWVSTVPGPNDTHNTHCQSSELSITIDWNPRGWGNQGRANDMLQPMIPAFLAKCSREAQVTSAGNATYFVEGLQYGYVVSPLKAGDVRVNMP